VYVALLTQWRLSQELAVEAAAAAAVANTTSEQLVLRPQPCSAVCIRCLNNLADVYNSEHDDVGIYITILQLAALFLEDAEAAHYARYYTYYMLHTYMELFIYGVCLPTSTLHNVT
jgi:hypothetical protein